MNRSSILRVLGRLDRLIGNLNIVLVTVVFCLFVLDTTIFATLILTNEVLEWRRIAVTSAVDVARTANFSPSGERW